MTKDQALREFRSTWQEVIRAHPTWRGDSIAKREMWNNFTDELCRSGQITLRQYETWSNPF